MNYKKRERKVEGATEREKENFKKQKREIDKGKKRNKEGKTRKIKRERI